MRHWVGAKWKMIVLTVPLLCLAFYGIAAWQRWDVIVIAARLGWICNDGYPACR